MVDEKIKENKEKFYIIFGYPVPGYYFRNPDTEMVRLLEQSVRYKIDVLSPWLKEKYPQKY